MGYGSGKSPKDDCEMVKIKGGEVTLGCVPGDSQCDANESPTRKIMVSTFQMDVHEVTVEQYKRCVLDGKCKTQVFELPPEYNFTTNYVAPERQNHPLNAVTWEDARDYCGWAGKNLPTEAQFAKALRIGHESSIYPWGDDPQPPNFNGNFLSCEISQCNLGWDPIPAYLDGYMGTSPVCRYGKNEAGLCDLNGNVMEWCRDVYDPTWLFKMPIKNPVNDLEKGKYRSVRGGSWGDASEMLRISTRRYLEPDQGSLLLGFRCMME